MALPNGSESWIAVLGVSISTEFNMEHAPLPPQLLSSTRQIRERDFIHVPLCGQEELHILEVSFLDDPTVMVP